MPHVTTLSQALTDRLHEQADARETRYILLQEQARCLHDQTAEVCTRYTFTRDNENCRMTPEGVAVQCAMRLTDKETGQSLSVVAKVDGEDLFWYILDMSAAPYAASVYIAAVQCRIEANRNNDSNRKAVQA